MCVKKQTLSCCLTTTIQSNDILYFCRENIKSTIVLKVLVMHTKVCYNLKISGHRQSIFLHTSPILEGRNDVQGSFKSITLQYWGGFDPLIWPMAMKRWFICFRNLLRILRYIFFPRVLKK